MEYSLGTCAAGYLCRSARNLLLPTCAHLRAPPPAPAHTRLPPGVSAQGFRQPTGLPAPLPLVPVAWPPLARPTQDAKMFRRKRWRYLILDEAHMIKNWKSQRWQTLLRFNSKRRLLITGAPFGGGGFRECVCVRGGGGGGRWAAAGRGRCGPDGAAAVGLMEVDGLGGGGMGRHSPRGAAA